jgi:Ca-activated chloride channel family protein
MAGEKFTLARRAVEQALEQLQPEDRFALVVYDAEVDVLVESTPATPEARRAALERLARIGPRGATDLAGGWMRGCEQVALGIGALARGAEPAIDEPAISRCLLLTDGLANHGLTDRDQLIGHAAALRERGVQTSTFGVGEDFDEVLLAGMADAGGGHFYYLAEARQIPELIASEVGEALEVVLRHAALEVRLAPGMTAEPLTRFRSRVVEAEEGRPVLRVELGDLVSGQEVEVVVALRFPRGAAGDAVEAEVGLVGGDGLPCAPAAPLRFAYATHAENDGQPRDRAVDRRVAALYAARARAEALEHNRAGQYERARQVLTATARRIREYAGGDPELTRLADALLQDVEVHTDAPMPAMEMKARFSSAHNLQASRAPSGQARRRAPDA